MKLLDIILFENQSAVRQQGVTRSDVQQMMKRHKVITYNCSEYYGGDDCELAVLLDVPPDVSYAKAMQISDRASDDEEVRTYIVSGLTQDWDDVDVWNEMLPWPGGPSNGEERRKIYAMEFLTWVGYVETLVASYNNDESDF